MGFFREGDFNMKITILANYKRSHFFNIKNVATFIIIINLNIRTNDWSINIEDLFKRKLRIFLRM